MMNLTHSQKKTDTGPKSDRFVCYKTDLIRKISKTWLFRLNCLASIRGTNLRIIQNGRQRSSTATCWGV